jgi:hypothetical protein
MGLHALTGHLVLVLSAGLGESFRGRKAGCHTRNGALEESPMDRSLMMLGLIGLGAVGGALSGRLPLYGKAALGLSLLPLGATALSRTFC